MWDVQLDSPLFDLPFHRSIPFLLRAILASSTRVSEMLKFTSGDTSKNPIECFSAYSSASSWWTCRLNAKCNRLPTKTLGIPGACWKIDVIYMRPKTLIFGGNIPNVISIVYVYTYLVNFFQPAVNAFKGPFICYIIN